MLIAGAKSHAVAVGTSKTVAICAGIPVWVESAGGMDCVDECDVAFCNETLVALRYLNAVTCCSNECYGISAVTGDFKVTIYFKIYGPKF